jgi:2-polyprenyl-6-methoxyphenol hydroxylase-like FAD-dependent oxidoreductase
LDIGIVGAGTAGLATAIALARRGVGHACLKSTQRYLRWARDC